ncbi:MAG: PqqD family protein [Balneolaceae bacterium]|nr:MAG: PqqD family protein [Balneolaceae bacterium]
MPIEKSYQRISNSVSGLLDDELVMMDIEKGKYFSLNIVATHIWEYIKEPRTFPEICDYLLSEYDVDEATCKKEVSELITELEKLGLVLRK